MLSTLAYTQPVSAMRAPSRTTRHPQVGLWIDTGTSSGQELVQGLLSYVRSHTTWRVCIPERRTSESIADVNSQADGLIAQIDSPSQAAEVAKLQIPTVNAGGEYDGPEFSLVAANDAAIAEMALDHLTRLGFKRLGFCGIAGRRSSVARRRAFLNQAAALGVEACLFETQEEADWESSRDEIAAWLETQTKPLGLLACDDAQGQKVLDAASFAKLRVPRDVAVLGIGSDELICGVADPPLSSVALDNRRVGYQAARRLHNMLEKKVKVSKQFFMDPVEVIARPSTDFLVVDDPEVAAAARFIRENALRGIKVADVLKAVPVSRRVLETRFRAQFGRTLHQEILSAQLEYIKELLRDSDLSMFQIATRCGFRHVEYMSVAFKREVGVTPSDYRNEWQEGR